MAATTRLLAKSGVCIAVINYDDVLLLATGVTIANISGVETVVFNISVLGIESSRTVAIGQTAFIPLASLAISIGTAFNGQPSFVIASVDGYGIGSG